MKKLSLLLNTIKKSMSHGNSKIVNKATGASATVNMRDIPAGVYVLRVMDADGKEYHRKIVRK